MEAGRHHRHLVAIPYPGRGHINPMMNFCHLLVSKNNDILVTVIVTEEWLHLLSSSPPLITNSNIRLRAIPNVLPSEKIRGADMGSFLRAIETRMEGPVGDLITRLDPPVDSILSDSFLQWPPRIGERMRVPVSSLFTQSATMFLAWIHSLEPYPHQSQDHHSWGEGNKCMDYLPFVTAKMKAFLGENVLLNFFKHFSWCTAAQSLLFTSSYELETEAIDALRSKFPLPIYTIGPSIPHTTLDATSPFPYSDWLDSQPTRSVIYISLGSYIPVSTAQMDELAQGLKMSNVRFLWVARDESDRIRESSGESGLVVPWSDQLRVLSHRSVGGFFTHCGWNSTLEGLFAGVPMLTFPLTWDQFPNSRLVVDKWKVGMGVKVGENVVGREKIAESLRKLMDLDGEESKKIRRNAKELKEMCRKALGENGSSSVNIDAFVKGCTDCKEN